MKKTMEKDTTDKDASTDSARLTPHKVYTELGSDDVLLGRGTGPNEFEGNIRFRRLVGEVAMATDPKGLLSNKPVLARRVVDEVTNRGGRFVRKLSKAEVLALANIAPINKRKDLYVEVPHAVAIEKAKQSFRHQEKIILDRREDPSRAEKGVVRKTSCLKSPPTMSTKDDLLLPPPDKHSRGVPGVKPKDDIEKRSKVGSSTITTDHITETQPSIETMMPLRTEHNAVSLPSSFMDYPNILSQSHALQALPTDTTSLLLPAQQQSSGPHNNNMGALASAFPLFHHGILDPSSLLYFPQSHTSTMELLNEVSRRHDLTALLGSSTARSATLTSTSQGNRIPDVATQQQEQQQSHASVSLLQLLQEYYPPPPVSLSSRVPLTTTSLSSTPLPPPPWSSTLLQNSLALGLIGGGAGTGLPGGSVDFSLSSSILQQQQQQRQILLASLGGALGLAQESSGEGVVVGPSRLQQAISSSGGGEGGVLESGTDSLLAASRMATTAPAPLSNVGTNDGSRWPPPTSHNDSSTPAVETERNNVASDQQQQQQQQASLLEYILRLRRP